MRCLLLIVLFVALAAAQACTYTDEKTGRYWYFAYANNPTSDYEFPRDEYGQYFFFQPCAGTFTCETQGKEDVPLCQLDAVGKWHACGSLNQVTYVPGEHWLDVIYGGGDSGRSTTVRLRCGDENPGVTGTSVIENSAKNYTVEFRSIWGCYKEVPVASSSSSSTGRHSRSTEGSTTEETRSTTGRDTRSSTSGCENTSGGESTEMSSAVRRPGRCSGSTSSENPSSSRGSGSGSGSGSGGSSGGRLPVRRPSRGVQRN